MIVVEERITIPERNKGTLYHTGPHRIGGGQKAELGEWQVSLSCGFLGNEWARKGNRVEGCFSRSLHEKTNFFITPEEVML